MYWWIHSHVVLHVIHLGYIRCIVLLSGALIYDIN